MAEASENLKKVMEAMPAVKDLADKKEAMRQALIAKGIDEGNLDDFTKYANILKSFNFSIDSTIETNGYTKNFGTDDEPMTLSSIMAEELKHNAVLKDKTEYKAYDFNGDDLITYLTVKPINGSLAYFCTNATSLLYVPQLDFSKCTSLNWAFSGCNYNNMILHDEYTVDLSNCESLVYTQFPFTKKLIIKNMRDDCPVSQTFYYNITIESIEGLNLTYHTGRVNVLFIGASKLTHIGFAEGSVIRAANVVSNLYDEPTADETQWDKYDAETLYNLCNHAYDWTTNPNSYTKITGIVSDGGTLATNYYNYHFSATAKAKLEEAYPDVDFTKMMEDKGWQY